MRILILTTQDRFFLSHIVERANYFKEQGCIVAVAAQKTSDEFTEKIRLLGFTFFDTKIERQSINLFTQFAAILRLLKIQFIFKPDISYNLGAKAIFYGTLTARLHDCNVGIVNAPIGLGYVFASKGLKARILRPVVLFAYRLFLNPTKSRVIIENFDDINFFIKKGCLNPKDAFCILGAGVDTDRFKPLPFQERNLVCTVIMASRLIKEKGVFDFIEVASRLYTLKVPVRMQLVGEPDHGNPSSLTTEDIENIKRNPAIEYLGFQSDMASILKKAHICCLPSYYREGLPRVLVEAASSGLTILTTDTIGCKEAVREQNGFLFAAHDTNKLFQLISLLVSNPQELEATCNRSRKVAQKFFDTQIIAKRTFDIIQSI